MSLKAYDLKSIVSDTLLRMILKDSPNCLIPLFHGTDRALYDMGIENRTVLRKACETVIDFLLPIYESHNFENISSQSKSDILGALHVKVLNAYGKATRRRNNCAAYQYNETYLTFDPDKANTYAKNAWVCGELGYVAYWLWRGMELLKYDLPNVTNDQMHAIELVKAAGARTPDPIVLAFFNIPKDRLQTEKGDNIDWNRKIDWFLQHHHYGEVRILGEFDISQGVIVDITTFPMASQP